MPVAPLHEGLYFNRCLIIADYTEVVNVSICLEGGTTYSIECHYLNNSNVAGCIFVLMGEGEERLEGTIDREFFDSARVRVRNIHLYTKLVAFDLEKESNIIFGTLPFTTELGLIEHCILTGTPY